MSAKAVAGTIAKPQLRGHLKDTLKFNLIITGIASLAAGLAWKYGVAEPRKRKYAEFYKTYDPEADGERMDALGLFTYFRNHPKDD